MSPAAMPFDVTRFGASGPRPLDPSSGLLWETLSAAGVCGTSMSAGWTSGMSGTLRSGPDGPLRWPSAHAPDGGGSGFDWRHRGDALSQDGGAPGRGRDGALRRLDRPGGRLARG